jgi:hypothetical protein
MGYLAFTGAHIRFSERLHAKETFSVKRVIPDERRQHLKVTGNPVQFCMTNGNSAKRLKRAGKAPYEIVRTSVGYRR